jgi:glutamate-1-semialdehyde 2,1-aminomutase
MTILETYERLHTRSAALYRRACERLPSGLTHDARRAEPFPLYVERSAGARKWDVDGHEVIDYWTGHGALLLGHGHPDVVAAVQAQVVRGTHFGAEHALILRWAELVQQLFPSMETLRFTASGTEATMLAVRLARAFTGRTLIVRFAGHYHGWQDTLMHGMDLDLTPPAGLPPGLLDSTLVLPAEPGQVEQVLHERDDVAAVILEPTGASYGTVPLPAGFLQGLRTMTADRGVLLIMDEVVTGFRVAPGGEQARTGVRPDLTALAKILAGGLPGGAVGGRADVMRLLAFGDATWNRERKIKHNGTYNANPLAAAAGIAALEQVATGAPGARAAARGQALVAGLNAIFREQGLDGWAAYGDGSIFHLIVGGRSAGRPGDLPEDLSAEEYKRGGQARVLNLLRMALVNHGVDLMRGRSGFLSAAHTEADIAATINAFAAALEDLAAEGVLDQ